MAIIDELIAVLGFKMQGEAEAKRFTANLAGMEKQALAVGAALARAGAVAGAAAAAGFGFLGNSVLKTAGQFEKFEATLTTIEGSAEKAKAAMSWITDFAKTTPYEVSELTENFVKLRAYGIDPMNGTMAMLGDTASAMGKSLNQAVEAYADAMTGEYERLKEFGIRAKKEKDNVTFTWNEGGKEINKTVKASSVETAKVLNDVWGKRFGGAMIRQSKTWQGMLSNMSDWWSAFQRKIADSGFFDKVKNQLASVLEALERWESDGTLTRVAKMFGDAFSWIADASATLFNRISTHIKFINDNWAAMEPYVKALGIALGALAIYAAPVAAAFVAIAAIADDVFTYFQGGESITGNLVRVFRDLWKEVVAVWDAFEEFWNGIIAWRNELVERFKQLGRDAGQSLLDGLKTMGQDIKDWFIGLVPERLRGFFGMEETSPSSTTGGGAPSQGIRGAAARGANTTGQKGGAKFSEMGARIMKRLMEEQGLTVDQAAGVVGNLGHESGGFTQMEEGSPNRYGTRGLNLAQWTNTPGSPRRTMFENWARKNGYDPRDPRAGEAYLFEDPEFKTAIRKVKGTTTRQGSMLAFEQGFERAAAKHKAYGSRMQYANKAAGLVGGPSATPAEGTPEHTNWLRHQNRIKAIQSAGAPARAAANSNVTVNAPVNLQVQRPDQAPEATAKAVGGAVEKGVQPARMQAGPAR